MRDREAAVSNQQRSVPAADAATEMANLLFGAWVARLIHTTAELGIADQFGDVPRDATDLANATSTHAPSLARLLRALTAIGVLHESEDRRYTLTALGATLRSGVPGSMRAWALLAFSDDQGKAWEALTHAVRTGEHAFRHLFGTDLWTRLAARPDAARLFDEGMQSLTQGVYDTLITHYPFGNYKWIVDVGGGNGALLLPVAARHHDLRVTIFDLPHVANAARLRIAEQGLAPRCEAIAGDAFVSVPTGADAYVLKGVIHDWEDEQAIQILRNCRDAMPDSSILIVIERILPERIDPANAMTRAKFITDINMFLNPGGRERTEAEFRGLFAKAGLRLRRTLSPPGVQHIMEVEVM
jgi:hypothetical protein